MHRILAAVVLFASGVPAQERLRVLFLGDRGHHKPAERLHDVHASLAKRGVDLFYTDQVADLNAKKLAHYDCVLLYANHLALPKKNEEALLEFVEGGKGFVPVHCASACFVRSQKFIALVGGQFRRHGTGTFSVETVKPDHPAVRGLTGFESWDETYVHARLSGDRTVLQFREEKDGRKEPWTWVRTQGKGRVFYTAWGHDQRTWGKAGFHDLIERGLRWASGDRFVDARPPAPKFEFEAAKVPNYQAGVARKDMKNFPLMQKAMSPDASQQRLRVPPEFRVERFAAEPQILKPIAMAWDQRGRLWIAETVDYPNELKKEGEGRDQIKICEDTDGDGRADKFTVFADKLSIPTSLVHVRGGVIVAQAPHFLFLKDTNGDDRADVREKLFTGWSTGDTHAGPSNLRYGFDNRIWGAVGYSGFNGTIGGTKHSFRQGFFQFTPDGKSLEFLISTTNNTWGLGFSEDGFVFGSTANGNPSVYMPIPNRYYEKVRGWSAPRMNTIAETTKFHPITDKVRQVDWHGKYTAAAGHALYTARSFPEAYWNRAAFVAAPTGHLLEQFFLEREGTHFVTRDGFNLLASDDEWTAPIMAEVGPDGAVWVIDWYNYIVQHNPTPRGFKTGKGNAYETPLRDKRHGRIYRIVHKDGKPSPRPGLDSVVDLTVALGHENLFWRLTAQRLLVEHQPTGAVTGLLTWLDDEWADGLGMNVGVQHALWSLHGLGAIGKIDAPRRKKLLAHKSAAVRRTAIQVLPPATVAASCTALLRDADPHVRLATLLALTEATPSEAVGRQVFAVMRDAKNMADRWLPDAATMAAARHGGGFLAAALEQFEAKAAKPALAVNLMPNADFEKGEKGDKDKPGKPADWKVRHYNGKAVHEFVEEGRNGGWCLKISSETGADTSWFANVPLEPQATYSFTGWVKTQGVQKKANALGAMFNMHELQFDRKTVRTGGLFGDHDWTPLSVTFDARGVTKVGINCLYGAWGQMTGTVWYDDVRLVKIRGSALTGKLGQAISRVMTSYAESAPVDTVGGLLTKIRKASPGLAQSLLQGLRRGWRSERRPELGESELGALRTWLVAAEPALAIEFLGLMTKWQLQGEFRAAAAKLGDRLHQVVGLDGDPDARLLAAQQVVALEPALDAGVAEVYVAALVRVIRPQMDPGFAVGLLRSVGASRNDAVGGLIVKQWKNFTGPVRKAAVSALMRRPKWTEALLRAVAAGSVNAAELSGAQWTQLEKHPDAKVRELAAAARTNKPSPERRAVVEKFLAAAKRKGDAANGKALFATHCAQCHRIAGAGGTLGPELDGAGGNAPEDLLTAILDPNQSVDGTYLMWVVETKDDEFLAGRLDAESKTTITIRDVEDKSHVIQRADIQSMESSKVSLMPANFEILGDQGLADLLTYLRGTHPKK